MMLQLFNLRIFAILVGYGIIILFFLFLTYKILRFYRNRLNSFFCCYYITVSIALVINIIYAFLKEPKIVLFLNQITNYLLSFSPIFITIFCIIFYKGQDPYTIRKVSILFVIYAILLLGIFFIPDGVLINEGTNWYPIWSWVLFIYVSSIIIIFSMIPTFFYSFQIYGKIEDDEIKRKWIFFIIGLIILCFNLIGTFLINTLNIPAINPIWSTFLLISCLCGAYFTYYGVAGKV